MQAEYTASEERDRRTYSRHVTRETILKAVSRARIREREVRKGDANTEKN
jgi:hypothetical protein